MVRNKGFQKIVRKKTISVKQASCKIAFFIRGADFSDCRRIRRR